MYLVFSTEIQQRKLCLVKFSIFLTFYKLLFSIGKKAEEYNPRPVNQAVYAVANPKLHNTKHTKHTNV